MAEALALSALGWVASPVLKILIEKTVTYLGIDLAKELQDLEVIIIPQLELVIKAAENSPHKSIIINWLRRLKKAFYDTEDILDELEYESIERDLENEKKSSSTSTILKPFKKLHNEVSKKVSLMSPTQRKYWKQLKELKKFVEEAKALCELLKIQPEHSLNQTTLVFQGPKPSASFPVNKVIGRERDRDRIIDVLVGEPIEDCNPAIAIIGIGGAGKTTLAQFIFNDQKILNHFDLRIWVCLSPQLSVIKNTKEMIESALRKCPQLESIDALQRELNDTLLNSKRILLVLDDVCYNGQTEEEEWSQLLAPFTCLVRKHKILLTSRSKSLPNALYPVKPIDLEELEENEFKSLFRHFAFVGANSMQIKELEEIGDMIVEKLPRSPLSAKAVASRLNRNLDYREWRNILDNVNLSSISESLLWTYQRLDAQLQRCFLYCSIFPIWYLFTEFELVNLWLSENFIKCSDDTNIKEKAKEYFNELIACSFFQPAGTDLLVNIKYKIHDLFHDLAKKLSKEDCFMVYGKPKKIPSTIRHVSIFVSDLKEHLSIISESDQLRTILFLEPFVNDANEIFKELLSKLKKLRVLKLSFYNDIKLPELVGKLKHLQYLDVVWSTVSELPDSISMLYHLQVLSLSASVKNLPENLSNLKKLQQLLLFDAKGEPIGRLPAIANIGSLTLLETARQFHVKKENGFELHQLGNFNRLKGDLRIKNLENSNIVDGIEAKLCEKKDLERLELVWGDYDSLRSDFDLELIETLQPHANLKHILLQNYSSDKYPNWLLFF